MTRTVHLQEIELVVPSIANHNSLKGFILNRGRLPRADRKILNVPSFEAFAGDKICVVGRNGNGKTTFLKIVSQIYPPSSGSVWTIARPTAVLAAGIGLEDELSVLENIRLSLILKNIDSRRAKELESQILDFCELTDDQNKQYKHLSTGFKSRLAFSIAVSEDPRILVLDEVLGGGDEFFMKKANARLQETIDKAETAFIATHGPDEMRDLCNRLILIEGGAIAFDGDFDEGLHFYRTKNQ